MIKELPKQFTGGGEVRGFEFVRNQSGNRAYLYGVQKVNGSIHYEVFVKKTVPVCIDFATKTYSDTDRKEVYPKGRVFGETAWSFKDYSKALKKYSELEAKEVK